MESVDYQKKMKTIVIASKNPVKIKAVKRAFTRMFPGQMFKLESVAVTSGVSDQPKSDAEVLQGAENRARNAKKELSNANYWVGIEGGIEDNEFGMAAFAWIVIISEQQIGRGRTGAFFLPEKVARLVRQGKELGEANDIVFNRSNSKQNNGAIGLLTGNVIDRTRLYEHGVIMALVGFKNIELYENQAT